MVCIFQQETHAHTNQKHPTQRDSQNLSMHGHGPLFAVLLPLAEIKTTHNNYVDRSHHSLRGQVILLPLLPL